MIRERWRSLFVSAALAGAFAIAPAFASDGYVQKWEKISDMLFLDLNSIAHTASGGVYANAYFGPVGTSYVENFQHLLFDCRGSYKSAASFGSPVLPAVPGTAIGEFAAVACSSPDGSAARPAHAIAQPPYCKGFGGDDCRYIREFVENDIEPDWCEGGLTRQLSAKELRICLAMGIDRNAH